MGSSSDIVPDRSSPGNHRSPADDASPVAGTKIPAEDPTTLRRTRPSRACTVRAQERLQEQQAAERKVRPLKKECKRREEEVDDDDAEEEEEDEKNQRQCVGGGSSGKSKIVTFLVPPPEPSQMPRWNLRSTWELASVLNFLHVSSLSLSLLFNCLLLLAAND